MNWVGRLYRSSIGAKLVVALTGILLFGFVIAHLLGNLQVFAGPDKLNHYAQALRDLGPLLWVARIGLIVLAIVHVATALRLAKQNEAARPVAYVKQASRQVRVQTKTMVMTGLVILAYVIYHLAHFTWGAIFSQYYALEEKLPDGTVRHDVYAMLVSGFNVWWVSVSYIVAMGLLALHLCHGITSFFQTLGVHHAKYNGAIRLLGPALSTLIFVGYASIPAAVWIGIVKLPEVAR